MTTPVTVVTLKTFKYIIVGYPTREKLIYLQTIQYKNVKNSKKNKLGAIDLYKKLSFLVKLSKLYFFENLKTKPIKKKKNKKKSQFKTK